MAVTMDVIGCDDFIWIKEDLWITDNTTIAKG